MANGEALSDARQMALTLARSGRFCGWRLIEIELRFIRGLAIARDFFQDLKLRDELDGLCRASQRHRRRQADLPPVPQYRFRGGELRRPPVIRFLTDTDGGTPAEAPAPTFAGALLGAEY